MEGLYSSYNNLSLSQNGALLINDIKDRAKHSSVNDEDSIREHINTLSPEQVDSLYEELQNLPEEPLSSSTEVFEEIYNASSLSSYEAPQGVATFTLNIPSTQYDIERTNSSLKACSDSEDSPISSPKASSYDLSYTASSLSSLLIHP